jgi:hypothetical protein
MHHHTRRVDRQRTDAREREAPTAIVSLDDGRLRRDPVSRTRGGWEQPPRGRRTRSDTCSRTPAGSVQT